MRRALIILVALVGCQDAAPEVVEALEFPSQGGGGKEDAFGRKLIGIAAPYPADLELAGREDVLKTDMAARRQAGWAIALRALAPVPLLGLADGEAGESPAVPNVPRWQTWYGIEDMKRMFIELYERLGAVGRSARAPFPGEDLDSIEAWNAAALDRSNRWPLERYLDYVAALGKCPDDMDADACARLQQSQFSGAAGGNARITYAPATARHLLASYGDIVACLDRLGGLSLDASPSDPDNFAFCMEEEMPLDAVLIKAQWVRSDFGRKLPAFDTDADALAKTLGPSQSADWGTAGREANPSARDVYTIKLKNGDSYRLAGLHIMTKELRHWSWVTLWWSDTPDSDFGADRPVSFAGLDPVWSHYKMCVVVDYLEGDSDPAARFAETPSLAAALSVVGSAGEPTWCSNPYIEHGRGNARTNCIGCHQHGGSEAGHDLDDDGAPDPFVLERVIDSESLFPKNGRTQIRTVFPSDYLWSTVRVDDSAHVFLNSMEQFGSKDARDPDVRAHRIVGLTGDPVRGGQIFADSCAPCHGPEGRGSAAAPSLYDRVPSLDPQAIAKTLVGGKNDMPAWGERFDDQALADVLANVRATFVSLP